MEKGVKGKSSPIIAKIISVLYYVLSAACAITLLYVIVNFISGNHFRFQVQFTILGFILAILFSGGFSVLFFYIGKGLWRGQNWARIIAIIFSIIDMLWFALILYRGSAIFDYIGFSPQKILGKIMLNSIIPDIVFIIINLLIVIYLLFNKKVRAFYN